jgi:hypothetical protein
MSFSKTRAVSAAVLVLTAAAGLAFLPGTPRSQDQVQAQETGTWQDLVLLYASDTKGKIEPCG